MFIKDVWDFQLISSNIIIRSLNKRDNFVPFFMTDQRIYTFPSFFFVLHTFCLK